MNDVVTKLTKTKPKGVIGDMEIPDMQLCRICQSYQENQQKF